MALNPLVRVGCAALTALPLLLAGPAAAAPPWRIGPTTLASHATGQPKVVDLRWAEHARFDRVVIDLQGRRPGVRARYVARLRYDGSGRPVPLHGRHKLSVVLDPARAHDAAGRSTYAGPRLRQVDLPTLRGIAFAGDFEGVVSFGFTARTRPYRVFTLTDPSRIVIDWRH